MKSLTWDGLRHSNFSFAIVTRNMLWALHRNGVDVCFSAWADVQTKIEDEVLDFLQMKPLNRDIGLRISSPDSWKFLGKLGVREKIGLLPWELNLVDTDWVEFMVNDVNWIYAQSEYNKLAFINSGIPEEMIKVVPYGVDMDLYNSDEEITRSWKEEMDRVIPEDYFKFMQIGTMQRRKGSDILVDAFLEEFSKDEKVSLYLKNYDPCGKDWEETNLAHYNPQVHPIIVHEYQEFGVPDGFVYNYYKYADCLVHCCRAEGFGMTMLEAMAMKLPVIATRYGGHRDFVNENNARLIDAEEVITDHWYHHTMNDRLKWHEPDKQHLRKLMREQFEDWKNKVSSHHVVEAYETAKRMSWDNSAKIFIKSFLED